MIIINSGRKINKNNLSDERIDDMTGNSRNINKHSGCKIGRNWPSCQLILLWLIFLLPGCNRTSSLQHYENLEAGVHLDKPATWNAEYYERNGQILLEPKNYFWSKRGTLVEIHGKSCLADRESYRPDLNGDIERIRNLYKIDSVSVIQEPTIIKTGDYEASKAVIEIPIAKMQRDDNRIRVENDGFGTLQTIELYAIWSQDRSIWAYVYKSKDELMNVQAREIVESIQFTCATPP